jgi:ABC-type Fe3+ transport system permease subunit
MSDLFDIIIYCVLIFCILLATLGIIAGIYSAIYGVKYRGWESPWSLIARDSFSLLATSLLFKAFSDERLDGFWTSVLVGLIGVPSMLYVVWNDHKYAQLTGEKGPFS